MIKFNLYDFFSVRRLAYWRWLLWQSQYYPSERQKALQWKLLSGLLDHCFENVPYYRDRWKALGLRRGDFKSLGDLSKLPVISKIDLLNHSDAFKSYRFEKYRPRSLQTTGTTGSPMKVYWDINSNVLELLCQWRYYSWFGYRIGMPFLDIRNFHQHLKGKWAWNWKCRGLETSIFFWNDSNAAECAGMLKKYKVLLWRGNPWAIYQLCRCFKQAGIRDAKPKYITTVGEMLLNYQRDFIENWTGCTIGDNYGLTEHTALMSQCPEGNYHIASEYGIVEILKEDGTPAEPGEEGRIISTGLHNRAFPLLRYDTGDYAVPAGGQCACGRTLPIVKELKGRIEDKVLAVNGKWIASLHWSFKSAAGIRCSQIVQNTAGSIDVYIVAMEEYNQDIQDGIVSGLHAELGDKMEIRVHLVDAVPFRSSKKYKFVVSRIADTKEK